MLPQTDTVADADTETSALDEARGEREGDVERHALPLKDGEPVPLRDLLGDCGSDADATRDAESAALADSAGAVGEDVADEHGDTEWLREGDDDVDGELAEEDDCAVERDSLGDAEGEKVCDALADTQPDTLGEALALEISEDDPDTVALLLSRAEGDCPPVKERVPLPQPLVDKDGALEAVASADGDASPTEDVGDSDADTLPVAQTLDVVETVLLPDGDAVDDALVDGETAIPLCVAPLVGGERIECDADALVETDRVPLLDADAEVDRRAVREPMPLSDAVGLPVAGHPLEDAPCECEADDDDFRDGDDDNDVLVHGLPLREGATTVGDRAPEPVAARPDALTDVETRALLLLVALIDGERELLRDIAADAEAEGLCMALDVGAGELDATSERFALADGRAEDVAFID